MMKTSEDRIKGLLDAVLLGDLSRAHAELFALQRESAEEMRAECAAHVQDDSEAERILALPLPGEVEAGVREG